VTVPFLFRCLAALALLAGPAAAQEVRFRTPYPGSQHILIDGQLGGRGSFTLLLDTGYVAPFVVALSRDAAERAGARAVDGPPFISRAAVGGPVSFDRASLPRLALGPVRLANVSVGITGAIDVVARAFGTRIDGIIGHDFLVGRTIAIDYPCRSVDLGAVPPGAAPTAGFMIGPVRPVLLVEARINGRGPFRLVLDTGAGQTIIAPGVANEAGIVARGSMTLMGAGGPEGGARTGRAEIALGSARARGIGVVVAPLVDRIAREVGARVDGIAGTNLFADGRLVLDYPGRRMWLQPARPCRAPAQDAKRQARVSPA
jgi:predicted aspartyl protease